MAAVPPPKGEGPAAIIRAVSHTMTMGSIKENEVEQAELEVRLRKYIIDLVQPTIRRTSQLEQLHAELQGVVQADEEKLNELEKMATKVEQQVLLVESFREEMGRWDSERRTFQAEAQESLSTMRTDLDSFRYQLEREDASIHSIQRTVDRVVGELSRMQDGSEALRRHVEKRLGQTTKQLNTTRTDLEVKVVHLETRFNRLNDELWGEETGLAKVMSDLRNTDRLVDQLAEDLKDMQHSKATVSQLQAVQGEVNSLVGESNSTIAVLKKSVDSSLNNLKEHFKTATNTVAAHNAVMLQEVRKSYQDELSASQKTRLEVMDFIKAAQADVGRLEDILNQRGIQTEEALRKISSEVEDVGKVRRRDKNNADVESQSMKTQLDQIHSTSKEVAKSLEHLSSVIWMVVQSEGAASALDTQDDTDRGKVALMGYRDVKGNAAAAARSRGTTKATSPNPQTPEDMGAGPVISIDHRCLSCSGQAQTVLSGFKMACLEYAPGPVSFAKKTWNRGELLEWRNKLLMQANEALQGGPIDFRREDLLASAPSPSQRRPPPGPSPSPLPAAGPPLSVAKTSTGGIGGGAADEGDRPGSRASSEKSGRGAGSGGGVLRMPPLHQRTLTAR